MMKTAQLYGGSLYDLAVAESSAAGSENLTEKIMEEMQAINEIFKENPEYPRLLSEPSIPKAERISLLDKSFGGQAEPYLINFLKLLSENGIIQDFNGCCREYRRRYNEDHNIAEAIVTSAVALSDAQADALKAKLESLSHKTIILIQKVDPAVVAGLRVEMDGRQLDGTVEGRLLNMRKRVSEIIV